MIPLMFAGLRSDLNPTLIINSNNLAPLGGVLDKLVTSDDEF